MTDLHPDCRPLEFLLGTWKGGGSGFYPTIDEFSYTDEVTFAHVGKPFLVFTQRTRHAQTGMPIHTETGYFRPIGETGVEVVMTYPTGHVEMAEGEVEQGRLACASTTVLSSPTAKPVAAIERVFTVNGAVLEYSLSMAAAGQPLQEHLSARLERVDEG